MAFRNGSGAIQITQLIHASSRAAGANRHREEGLLHCIFSLMRTRRCDRVAQSPLGLNARIDGEDLNAWQVGEGLALAYRNMRNRAARNPAARIESVDSIDQLLRGCAAARLRLTLAEPSSVDHRAAR
jgi:hypothetical protein